MWCICLPRLDATMRLKGAMAARFGGLVDTVSAGTPVDDPSGLPPDLIQEIQLIETPFQGFR